MTTNDNLAAMIKHGFDHVDGRFDKVEDRLDRIEQLVLKRHEEEIEKLKIRVHDLEDLFAMPAKK